MAQIIPIVSESLQKKIRDLLPSQQGFGEDLQASNVILPILDVTSAASGADVGQNLQTAWDFTTGHNQIANTTTTIINNTGFWQCDFVYRDENVANNVVSALANLFIDDGSTTKTIWQVSSVNSVSSNETQMATEQKFVVFLRATDSLKGFTSTERSVIDIWYRQIATLDGTLVNPSGFTPQ